MEYCEKSTLRDTIDQGLFRDTSRLWRLFREILDGLAYIHEKVSFRTSHVRGLLFTSVVMCVVCFLRFSQVCSLYVYVGVCRCVLCVYTCVQMRVFMEAEMSDSTTTVVLLLRQGFSLS